MQTLTSPLPAPQQLNRLGAGQPPSVFSQACRLHEVIDGDTFFAARVGNTYLSRAVPLWFLNNTRYEVGCHGVSRMECHGIAIHGFLVAASATYTCPGQCRCDYSTPHFLWSCWKCT